MTRVAANERHAHHERVNALAAQLTASNAAGKVLELLNLVNEAYAQGYRDADPDNRMYAAVPDGSEVIMDGAGRVISHVPPRTVVDGTVSGRLRTYVQGAHLHVWDEERSETIAMFEVPDNVAFNVHRATGELPGDTPDDQQWEHVAEEVRKRWAASRALPRPHRLVGLPADFVHKLVTRTEELSDDTAVKVGIRDALHLVVDQLDAWTEWDDKKGWR